MPTREIEFVTDGDSRHFPVALASIYSKYLRELYMHVFNTYWCGKMAEGQPAGPRCEGQRSSLPSLAGLRPTAGYYTDGRRWLREAASLLDRLSIDRGLLIRRR